MESDQTNCFNAVPDGSIWTEQKLRFGLEFGKWAEMIWLTHARTHARGTRAHVVLSISPDKGTQDLYASASGATYTTPRVLILTSWTTKLTFHQTTL